MGGSSAKKKREKKKDFQKPKLRVGKPAPKAANFTDTSFSARSIHLKPQSLSATAPSTPSQIAHHLALLRNRSPAQRHDSLAYLCNLPPAALADSADAVLPRLPALLHDEGGSVRGQVLKLLRRFPAGAILAQMELLLLWTRAGLTHISADVRVSSLEALDLLVGVAGEDVASARGAWVGFLRALTTVVGWKERGGEGGDGGDGTGWSNYQKQTGRLGSEGKVLARQLGSMAAFVEAGMRPPPEREAGDGAGDAGGLLLYAQLLQHAIPRRANAYAHLNLFGPPADEEHQIYENREDRQRVFHEIFEGTIRAGIEQVKKEGGELGRVATKLQRAVDTGMADFSN